MAEEKAQEGNTTYFSEFSSDELDAKLKRKDEDGRTLLHIAAADGTRPGDAQRKISLHQPSSAVPIPRTAIPNVDVSAEPPRASLPPSPSGRTELVELFLAHPTGRAAVNKGDEVSPRKQGAL